MWKDWCSEFILKIRSRFISRILWVTKLNQEYILKWLAKWPLLACGFAFILRHLKLPPDKSSRTHIWYVKSQEYFFTWVQKNWSRHKLLLSPLVFHYPKFTLKSKSNDMLGVTRSLERCFTTRIRKKNICCPHGTNSKTNPEQNGNIQSYRLVSSKSLQVKSLFKYHF